jgi:hypothetical protein
LRFADDRYDHASHAGPVKKNIALLYGVSFFDQFMIMIALWDVRGVTLTRGRVV